MKSVAPAIQGGWTDEKVRAYQEAYEIFSSQIYFDSKETGRTCLASNRYQSQKWFLKAIWDGLADDIHDFKFLKSRQLGCTTEARALDAFWLGIHDGMRGATVFDTDGHKEEARIEMEAMLRNLPRSVKFPRVKTLNRYMMTLSNDAMMRFMSAGIRTSKSSGVLGRSSGINFLHASEMCSWDAPEGLKALKQSLAEEFPDRLYLWESTGRGFNDWHDMWEEAKADDLNQRATFLGWWLKDTQIIRYGTEMWERYGASDVTPEEAKRIHEVKKLYGWDVTREQLAWYRRKMDPARERDADDAEDSLDLQEQPWCVVAGTRVGTSAGILRIEDIDPGVEATLGPVLGAGPTGSAVIWRARTHLGYEIRGTDNHPLIGESGDEIELGRSAGARVRLQSPRFAETVYVIRWKEGPIECAVETTPDLARLVGIFMGDGSISGGYGHHGPNFSVSICCNLEDSDFVSECCRLFETLFPVKAQLKYDDPHETGGWVSVRVSSKPVVEFFRKLGLCRNDTIKTMRKIHVPEFIWRSPRYVVKEFLSGLFETDGFNAYDTHRCALFSKYPEFVRDIQVLLLGFGITSYRREVTKIAPNGTEYLGCQLSLRKNEAIRFNEEIGFLSRRKKARAIKPERQIDERYDRSKPIEFLDEVVLVECLHSEETVYNVTVGDKHWFDANGILTHNTEDECFQATGSTFFDSVKLSQRMAEAVGHKYQAFKFWPGVDFFTSMIEPARTWRETQLKLWEEPQPDSTYVVAGDPAFGHDERNDRSALQVLRCYADQVEQVCEYASASTPTHQFAWLIVAIGAYYGLYGGSPVYQIVELNGPGGAVWREMGMLTAAIKTGYYAAAARAAGITDMINNIRQYVYTRTDSMTSGHVWQWKTQTQNKIEAMERCRDFIHNGRLLVRSQETLEEARSVTRDGDTIKAEGRKHDDRIFTLALGVRCWEERAQRRLMAENRTKAADMAKRALSIADQYQLYNQYMLTDLFKTKQQGRVMMLRTQQRQQWGRQRRY